MTDQLSPQTNCNVKFTICNYKFAHYVIIASDLRPITWLLKSCLCNEPLLTGTVMKKHKLESVCLCSSAFVIGDLQEVSLTPINSHPKLGGFLHRKRAGIVPDLFPHLIIKGKKWSDYMRLVCFPLSLMYQSLIQPRKSIL